MKAPPAPIRFLLLVVGGWVGFRTVVLTPGWIEESAAVEAPSATSAGPPRALAEASEATPKSLQQAHHAPAPFDVGHFGVSLRRVATPAQAQPLLSTLFVTRGAAPAPIEASPMTVPLIVQPRDALVAQPPLPPVPGFPSGAGLRPANRWNASAWLFLREKGGAGLAPGGILGGSQAGMRVRYRLNSDIQRTFAASARLYVPLDRPQGAEAAVGLDWRPLASFPFHLLAERRERIGNEGRSDFSLTLYGGGERRLLRGRLRLEAYGQAGIVGVEERNLFADGALRASVPVGPLELGAGAWGGAQPGVWRLDIGPQAMVRLPVGRGSIRASAEWRFRIAGDAAPNSGPALTISTDF